MRMSAEAARARLGEHLSDFIGLAPAAARASVRFGEEMQEQGAPEEDLTQFRAGIDRIMTAGSMFATAVEVELDAGRGDESGTASS